MNRPWTPSRRMFLRGAGGAVLALPFLPSLAPRGAAAAAEAGPKRFICLKSFSTQLIRSWYPALEGNGYVLRDSRYTGSKADGTTLLSELVDGGPYTRAPLADFATETGISDILGANLNPFLDKINLIRGLDFLPEVNHNYGGLLGNYSSCTAATPCDADSLEDIPTIDQVLAYSSKFYPQVPAQRSLHISQGVVDSMSFSDNGSGGTVDQLKARTNPRDVFNDIFGTFDGGGTGGPGTGDEDALLIDRVLDDYRALRSSSRLSADDKAKVDQYVDLVTGLQDKLRVRPVMSCTAPIEPESLENDSSTDPGPIAAKWDLFLDLVTAAIMCDRTRIVTLGIHKALGPGPDPSSDALVGHYHSEDASGGTWHGLAHDFPNENSRRMLAGINRWIANELVAKLLEKLDVEESGGSTYLDNSLLYWGNELGFNHIAYSVPCLTAGGAGGAIRTGQYLDYIDWEGRSYFSQEDGNVIKGIPHNRFLVSVLQSMGLDPSDYERGGQPGYGSTDTGAKNGDTWPIDYDFDAVGDPLPGLLNG